MPKNLLIAAIIHLVLLDAGLGHRSYRADLDRTLTEKRLTTEKIAPTRLPISSAVTLPNQPPSPPRRHCG